MRRKFNPTKDAPTYQAAIDHKAAALEAILAEIPVKSTFASLGELIGYSHDWVRRQLIGTPERLYKVGKRYWVPKGVAEELVRSTFV